MKPTRTVERMDQSTYRNSCYSEISWRWLRVFIIDRILSSKTNPYWVLVLDCKFCAKMYVFPLLPLWIHNVGSLWISAFSKSYQSFECFEWNFILSSFLTNWYNLLLLIQAAYKRSLELEPKWSFHSYTFSHLKPLFQLQCRWVSTFNFIISAFHCIQIIFFLERHIGLSPGTRRVIVWVTPPLFFFFFFSFHFPADLFNLWSISMCL